MTYSSSNLFTENPSSTQEKEGLNPKPNTFAVPEETLRAANTNCPKLIRRD